MAKEIKLNAKQEEFIELLKGAPEGLTLFEINLDREEDAVIKSGSVNSLVTRGLVGKKEEKREFAIDKMYNGKKIGTETKTGTVYFYIEK